MSVPSKPTGTETRKIRRQLMGARTPPKTRPMKDPLNAAAWLMPIAIPRFPAGNVSVNMAAELAINMAAPTPWKIRITMSQMPPGWPVSHVTLNANEKKVNTAKPRL